MAGDLAPYSSRALARVAQRPLPPYYDAGQVRTLLEALRAGPPGLGERDYWLGRALWHIGGRISEVLAIRPADLHEDRVQLTHTKGGRPRTVPVDRRFAAGLLAYAYRAGIPPAARIWPIGRHRAYQLVAAAAARAGLPPAHPHTLRHSFAVHAVKAGVPVHVLQGWMGHAFITTTLIYLRIVQSERDAMRQGVDFWGDDAA